MTVKEKIDELKLEIERLKLQKNISMSVTAYNDMLNLKKKEGMVQVINIVLDVINNRGVNITRNPDDVEMNKFVDLVLEATDKNVAEEVNKVGETND